MQMIYTAKMEHGARVGKVFAILFLIVFLRIQELYDFIN